MRTNELVNPPDPEHAAVLLETARRLTRVTSHALGAAVSAEIARLVQRIETERCGPILDRLEPLAAPERWEHDPHTQAAVLPRPVTWRPLARTLADLHRILGDAVRDYELLAPTVAQADARWLLLHCSELRAEQARVRALTERFQSATEASLRSGAARLAPRSGDRSRADVQLAQLRALRVRARVTADEFGDCLEAWDVARTALRELL